MLMMSFLGRGSVQEVQHLKEATGSSPHQVDAR